MAGVYPIPVFSCFRQTNKKKLFFDKKRKNKKQCVLFLLGKLVFKVENTFTDKVEIECGNVATWQLGSIDYWKCVSVCAVVTTRRLLTDGCSNIAKKKPLPSLNPKKSQKIKIICIDHWWTKSKSVWYKLK